MRYLVIVSVGILLCNHSAHADVCLNSVEKYKDGFTNYLDSVPVIWKQLHTLTSMHKKLLLEKLTNEQIKEKQTAIQKELDYIAKGMSQTMNALEVEHKKILNHCSADQVRLVKKWHITKIGEVLQSKDACHGKGFDLSYFENLSLDYVSRRLFACLTGEDKFFFNGKNYSTASGKKIH